MPLHVLLQRCGHYPSCSLPSVQPTVWILNLPLAEQYQYEKASLCRRSLLEQTYRAVPEVDTPSDVQTQQQAFPPQQPAAAAQSQQRGTVRPASDKIDDLDQRPSKTPGTGTSGASLDLDLDDGLDGGQEEDEEEDEEELDPASDAAFERFLAKSNETNAEAEAAAKAGA